MITVLSGGVGAARMLRGFLGVLPGTSLTAIVNVGDDATMHGLHISPDLDTITYTLAGAIDPVQGWGLEGETWHAMEALERYGGQTWFRLGDRDLATHLYRTQRRRDGAPLSSITAEIAAAWGLDLRLLPATDDPLHTRLSVPGEGDIEFQEYFVHRHHDVAVSGVRFAGAVATKPAPGVLGAIANADLVVIAPSNPLVSIAPILAVPGIDDAVRRRRDRVIAVSPIVGGAALKGPADRLLRDLGHEVSVVGVARLYRDQASVLVVDEVDALLADAVEAEGLRCLVAPAVMHGPTEAAALAQILLDTVG